MCALLALVLTGALPATAKPRKAPPPATVPSLSAPAPPPIASPAPVSSEPSPELLRKAKALYGQLEYDKVIPLTELLLERDDLPIDSKLEAHRLNGSAKAIVQDPVDAERPFRLLLRLRPEYDLPKDTPPKILAAFRKVQAEERALAAQAELFSRETKIEGLKFLDEPPGKARGGRPVPFSLRLRDPGAAVDAVTVPYRRRGQPAYSSLALQRDEEGKWVGQIPAEYTANDEGFTLEFYIESADAKGRLLAQGSAGAPLELEVSRGALASSRPPPVHRKVFFATLAGTLIAAAVSGALGVTTLALQRQYSTRSGVHDGASMLALLNLGQSAALATNIGWVVTGLVALVTGVLIPFVDWDPVD